jgi:hypothetical protein
MPLLLASLVLLALTPALGAQAAPESSLPQYWRGQGHALFGVATPVGDAGTVMALAAGGDGFVYKGLALGGDVGYLYTGARFTYGLGLASASVSYHFRGLDSSGRFVPFVTAGFSTAFRGDATGLANYGGGMTYWFHRHWGARVEIRNLQGSDASVALARFGLSFR